MSWLKWKPTSPVDLEQAEKNLLSYLKTPYKGYFVNIGGEDSNGNEENKIWTIEVKPKEVASNQTEKLPLVLIHGFAAGVGFWSLNYDSLSKSNRTVYAFDMPGFGRSSRLKFNYKSSEEVESQMVGAIERWRENVGLNKKFILLGHSFGAYISLAYALKYPNQVAHLVLADPWGMPTQQSIQQAHAPAPYKIPGWVKVVAKLAFQTFTPLAALRGAGPWGPSLVHKLRPDIRRKFEDFTGAEESKIILDYVYHCNAQDNPSGEKAFQSLCLPNGWARFPMIERVADINEKINLTFIYGSKSWVDRQPGLEIKCMLQDRIVDVHVIEGAGHHVYADNPTIFNELVNDASENVDKLSKGEDVPVEQNI